MKCIKMEFEKQTKINIILIMYIFVQKKCTKYSVLYVVNNAENKIGYYIRAKKMYKINVSAK